MISNRAWDILACPACDSVAISRDGSSAKCHDCDTAYAINATGQIDFRLQKPKHVSLEIELTSHSPHTTFEYSNLKPAVRAPGSIADRALTPDLTCGNRLTPDLLTHFPRSESRTGFMLDLGCEQRNFSSICKATNLEYIGIDYQGKDPDLLGDAHALPFKNEAFEFILSIAVLEHLRYPMLAMREAYRVLKPGGLFIGTVAFLEAFHMESFYHHTHLGTHNSLTLAGFEVKQISPNLKWTGLRALSEMVLIPKMPRVLAEMSLLPLRIISRLWWKWEDVRYKTQGHWDMWRQLSSTGGFQFIASKPAAARASASGSTAVMKSIGAGADLSLECPFAT